MLTCKSRAEASRQCGLALRTLQGYEKDPAFADALERGRREALADAAHRISAGYADTVDALQAIVQDDAAADPARVAAARALLEYGLKFAELTDVNRRLDKLEGLL
mgnify:CR=1 FL=1